LFPAMLQLALACLQVTLLKVLFVWGTDTLNINVLCSIAPAQSYSLCFALFEAHYKGQSLYTRAPVYVCEARGTHSSLLGETKGWFLCVPLGTPLRHKLLVGKQ
jgi:hypothetical protein